MKKLVCVLCILVFAMTCFAACGKDSAQIKDEKMEKLTENGVTEELASMYAYLNYVCNWDTSRRDFNGEAVYTDPYTAVYNIVNEGAVFYYAYEEGYFDDIIEKIKFLGDDYGDIVSNVERAKALSEKALSALINGEYTFAKDTGKYTLSKDEEIKNEYNALYSEYKAWL